MNKLLFISAILSLSAAGVQAVPPITKISGCVADTSVHAVTILKEGAHPMMLPATTVPVVDGKFSHEIRSEYPEAYYIVPGTTMWSLNGDWLFFTEGGTVQADIMSGGREPELKLSTVMPETVKLHRYMDASDNDPDYKAYEAFSDSIYGNDLVYYPEYESLEKELFATDDQASRSRIQAKLDSLENAGLKWTPAGLKGKEWGDRLSEKWKKRDLDFVEADGSLCGLFYIARNMWMPAAENHDKYIDIYERIYRDKYAGHPYSIEIERIIPVYRSECATVGTKYIDVEALDADGKMRPISDFIGGKVAIIDLWASWCGPCRRNSKAMIPLYEKYAPKGLAIIGLAREMKDDKVLRAAIKKDGYPWPSLAEINDRNMIWARYGTPNAPGRVLLVDRDGTILAIDPDYDTLESKLAELLK